MFMKWQYYCFFTFIQWLDQIVQEKSLGDGFNLYLFPEIQKIWLLDDFQKNLNEQVCSAVSFEWREILTFSLFC